MLPALVRIAAVHDRRLCLIDRDGRMLRLFLHRPDLCRCPPARFCGYMWLWNNNQAALTPYATLDYSSGYSFPTTPLAQRRFKDVLTDQPYPDGSQANPRPNGGGYYTGETLYQNLALAYEHWLVRPFPCALPAYPAPSLLTMLSQTPL